MLHTIAKLLCIPLIGVISLSCNDQGYYEEERLVRTGAEILIENHLQELEGQRVGLVMNPTARIGDVHMLDTLIALDVNISALFAPEHGFRGEAGAGEKIEDGVDQATGLPVHSLYGDTRKPTPEMLNDVDLLIFDMQDVGTRFYTYHATMGLVLEAAADAGVPVWILDRPNPAGGNYVSGWVMEEEFTSFVGPYPIPIAHGLTLGELARMMVGEGWLETETAPEVNVIQMEGWTRDMKWPDTGLEWVPPSPNLPTFEHAFVYLGTCLIEGTTMSEGRGTDDPFLTLGDPDTELTAADLDSLQNLTDGLVFSRTKFTPVSIPGVAPSPKHQDTESNGIKIDMRSVDFDPVRAGLQVLHILYQATPGAEIQPFLYRLAGSREIDKIISGEVHAEKMSFGVESFRQKRSDYLLYE